MDQVPQVHLRTVLDGEFAVWAQLSLATLVDVEETEEEFARRFAREPDYDRSAARLAWLDDRAVARLRFRAWPATGFAVVWGLGPIPALAVRGLERAVIQALEDHTVAAGARHLIVELHPQETAAFVAASYRLRKQRVAMQATLLSRAATCNLAVRPLRPGDRAEREQLSRLLHDAYADSVDYDGEPPDELRIEVERILSSRYGPFLPGCSFVLEERGVMAGAVLVTRESGTKVWLNELAILPLYRGRGCARPLIQAAMNAALLGGFREMGLTVTLGNIPAEGLYRRMGFAETPGTEQHHMEKEL